jgi:hypothetical protein
MGITETRKMIGMLKSDIIGLLSVDYSLVGEELSELDIEEKKELLIAIGGAFIEILACIKLGPSGAVFSVLSKLASK